MNTIQNRFKKGEKFTTKIKSFSGACVVTGTYKTPYTDLTNNFINKIEGVVVRDSLGTVGCFNALEQVELNRVNY